MKKKLLFLLIPFLVACDQFETRKINSEDILSEETRDFNWEEVDQYPAFKECRDIMDEEVARTCFGNKVAEYVYARLEQKQPVVSASLQDTLLLYISISEKGIPAIDSMEIDTVVIQHLPKIKSWLHQSIDSLPKIYPANKRGIPVGTKFRMPIVIKTD